MGLTVSRETAEKLAAKVTELQFELQTKNYEETIWHTAYSDLTTKNYEETIWHTAYSDLTVKRTFIQDYHDGKLEKNITEENNTKSKVSESSQKVKREFTHDDDDE
ncbi:hypothetical protein AC249_AIPGENE28219, partial [Exaiptasia diaphana]